MLASVALLGLDWPGQGAARAAEYAHAGPLRRVELLHLLAPSHEPEARAALAAGLSDPDPGVRESARRLAARYPSDDLVPALLRVLEDPSVAARSDALDALAGTRTADSRRAIERALSDRNTAVRTHAVQALSGAGADAVVPLLDRVHDPEGDVRAAAADALGRIGDARAALALVGISQDPIPEVRLAATRALGSLPGEVAARALVGLVHDPMPEVRLAALRGLQEHPDPATVPTLAALARPALAISLAGRDDVARAAIAALGGIDSPEARRALLDLALDPRAPRSPDAIRALLPHADRLRPDVGAILPRVTRDNVEALSELLGRIGGDEVAEALLELLSREPPSASPGPVPRATAAMHRALGRSGSDRALRALLERLTASRASWSHRSAGCSRGAVDPSLLEAISLWAGARQGLDPLSIDPLAEALGALDLSCHPQLATMLRLLGMTGNDRAAPALIAALRHPDAAIRVAAAQGLGRALSPTGLAPLLGAMSDGDASVRAAAATSLRAMPADSLLPALVARWRDPAPIDRGALLLVLGHALAADAVTPAARATHLPLLLDAASRGPWRTRAAAVRALGSVASSGVPSALQALATYAAVTADRRVALVAVEALGNLSSAPTPALRAALDAQLDASRDPASRAAAAWALRSAAPASVDALRALVDGPPSPAAHNALAALSRVDPTALDPAARDALRASALRLIEPRPSEPIPVNACALLARLGAPCAGRDPAAYGDAATTDLRVLDPERAPISRPVLLQLGDGATVWISPDVDGYIRVRDAAAGTLQVLDDDAP